MTGNLSDRALEREARRLFPKLDRDRGFLLPASSVAVRGGRVEVFTSRNGYRRPVDHVETSIFEALRQRDWICRASRGWRLSDVGRSWLRRQDATAQPFVEQHQERKSSQRDVSGVSRPVVINEAESPLDWLRSRKSLDGRPLLSDQQYQAGEKLRAEFTRAKLTPKVTSNWDSVASSRRSRRGVWDEGGSLSDSAIAARQRFQSALAAVGPDLAGILIDVCCLLHGLETAERNRGWPRRSGKTILQIALSSLARHYGYEKRSGDTRLLHWGSDDYRPGLDQWE